MMKYVVLIPLLCFLLISPVEAKTLGELKKELANLEASVKANQADKQMTQEQMSITKQNVATIQGEIEQASKDIDLLIGEIDNLNKDIEKKDQEMKSIVNFVQVSSGESAYLEYIFGAKSFTDFIYRMAISEQMVNYNDKLIKEYNEMIRKNNEKQKSLNQKKIGLGKKQQELELESSKLGQKIEVLEEGRLDLASQIKAQKEAIESLKGCRDDEDSVACNARLISEGSSSSFIRPLTSGTVSSEYGYRFHPTQGVWRLHTGIDLAASGASVPVYAAASGRVAAITRKSSCGGNVVYLHHTIGGKNYTSVYMHLRSINVSVGQNVTPSTVIATMGGNPAIEYWDKCSTGQHLHFTLANGFYFIEYSTYSAFEAHTFNPRNMVRFPGTWGSFSGR